MSVPRSMSPDTHPEDAPNRSHGNPFAQPRSQSQIQLQGKSRRHTGRRGEAGRPARPLQRRIVMNPPQSFIVAAAAANPASQQVGGPIAIGQGGQAVMIAAAADGRDTDTNANVPESGSGGEVVVNGSVLQIDATPATTSETTATVSITSNSDSATLATPMTSILTGTTAVASATSSVTSDSASAAPSQTALTVSTLVSTAASTSTSMAAFSSLSVVSSVLVATSSATSPSSSQRSSTITLTASHSSISNSISAVSSSASSAAAAAVATSTSAVPGMHHFLHSTPFYLLLVLGTLLLLAILATSVSWMVRHSCFPCCRPEVDDDGLNDLVQSFHPPSRSSTIRRMSLSGKEGVGPDETSLALGRRSSLFANEGKSPFLHSGTSELGEGDFGLPIMPPPSGFGPVNPFARTGAGSIKVPTPAHLYGETGPLEVRNAMPGEVEGEELGDEHGPMHGTPRFLGVDGSGLNVPWSRQSSGIGLGIHPDDSLADPYLSPPDARDYLGTPFPSPPATVDEHGPRFATTTTTNNTTTSTPTPPSPGSPQRAGTWASNLRSTLFAAISAARAPARAYGDTEDGDTGAEDKYTRTVLPLHRASTRRAAGAAFPIVEEDDDRDHNEKSAYRLPENDAAGTPVFLAPSFSRASSLSIARPGAAVTGGERPRIGMGLGSKRLPLRGSAGSAGERYKRYYARSQSHQSGSGSGSGESTADEESCAGWSEVEAVRGPSRLAGGERARGVRGSA